MKMWNVTKLNCLKTYPSQHIQIFEIIHFESIPFEKITLNLILCAREDFLITAVDLFSGKE